MKRRMKLCQRGALALVLVHKVVPEALAEAEVALMDRGAVVVLVESRA